MPQSYPVGQAPWETKSAPAGSFPVGQAPWEVNALPGSSPAQPPQSDNGFLGLKGLANAIVAPAVNAGMKMVRTGAGALGGLLGLGAAGVGAVTGNEGLKQGGLNFAAAETNPNIGVGGQPITPQNQATAGAPINSTEQAIGTGATLGSYLAGAGEVAPAEGMAATLSVGSKILNAAKGGAVAGGAFGLGQSAGNNQSAGSVALQTGLGALVGAGAGVAGSTIGNAPEIVGNIKQSIAGKSEQEVLSTAASDVYKLSPSERKTWFDAQQENIDAQRTTANAEVKTQLEQKATQSQAQADALKKQLDVASRDEVLALRPNIRSAMAQQSATYRSLVDEAIAPYVDTPVSATELKSFVESRFPDNPGMSDAINAKLGLTEKNVSAELQPGELPTITQEQSSIPFAGKYNASPADSTLGSIYRQAKSLGQDISAAATKGGKTYTPDDKMADDAIATLNDFMKSKGIDLSEANKFWAQYAPVRNQLVSEAKPFLQAPINTKTFANTLTRIAKGTDVNNENFIGAVEDLVGQPLATDQKTIVAQLDSNAKQQLADEVAAQAQKIENDLKAEQATKKLTSQQFETERAARLRAAVKNLFKYGTIAVGGAAGEKGLKSLGVPFLP